MAKNGVTCNNMHFATACNLITCPPPPNTMCVQVHVDLLKSVLLHTTIGLQASFTTKMKEQRWVAEDVLHEGM
jgi:hypothetical protein